MSVACVEAVLAHDQELTCHSWEATRYGVKKRCFDSGPKTRGSMQRNRSGEVVVSFGRLAEWQEGRPSVSDVRSSALWSQLREPRKMTEAEWGRLDVFSTLATHFSTRILGLSRHLKIDEEILRKLAACGTFDAISALWSLYVEAVAAGDMGFAFQCARYTVPAIGIFAGTTVGERIALLLFARLRQRWLDDVRCRGRMLLLNGCNVPAMQETAVRLSSLEIYAKGFYSREFVPIDKPSELDGFLRAYRLRVPSERVTWIQAHLPESASSCGASKRRTWLPNLSPFSHPLGPCHLKPPRAFHPSALARFQGALGAYA